MEIPLDLVFRCLEGHRSHASDTEAESVLADWAEETGFGGLAAGLRDSPNVRWSTLADFVRMIDPSWLTKSHDTIEKAQKAYEAQLATRRLHHPIDAAVDPWLDRAFSRDPESVRLLEHQERAARQTRFIEGIQPILRPILEAFISWPPEGSNERVREVGESEAEVSDREWVEEP